MFTCCLTYDCLESGENCGYSLDSKRTSPLYPEFRISSEGVMGFGLKKQIALPRFWCSGSHRNIGTFYFQKADIRLTTPKLLDKNFIRAIVHCRTRSGRYVCWMVGSSSNHFVVEKQTLSLQISTRDEPLYGGLPVDPYCTSNCLLGPETNEKLTSRWPVTTTQTQRKL
jgi:hypothetical protein